VFRLLERVNALAQTHPDGRRMLVKVMSPGGDYWPLPWYLRGFSKVGWWSDLLADPYAPVTIASTRLGAALDEKSEKKWLSVGYYQLRPPRAFLELFVEFPLWRKYLESRPPPKDEDE
jgi:hypothetical protein